MYINSHGGLVDKCRAYSTNKMSRKGIVKPYKHIFNTQSVYSLKYTILNTA